MHLAFSIAIMGKGGRSHTAVNETQFLIETPRHEIGEEKKRDVEFPEHKNVNAAIEMNPAMLRQNETPSYLHCQNGTANNPQTHCRHRGNGTPLPKRCR
jgi:hypothetical protein